MIFKSLCRNLSEQLSCLPLLLYVLTLLFAGGCWQGQEDILAETGGQEGREEELGGRDREAGFWRIGPKMPGPYHGLSPGPPDLIPWYCCDSTNIFYIITHQINQFL